MLLHCEETTSEIYIQYKKLEIDNASVVVQDIDTHEILEVMEQREEPERNFYILGMRESVKANSNVS